MLLENSLRVQQLTDWSKDKHWYSQMRDQKYLKHSRGQRFGCSEVEWLKHALGLIFRNTKCHEIKSIQNDFFENTLVIQQVPADDLPKHASALLPPDSMWTLSKTSPWTTLWYFTSWLIHNVSALIFTIWSAHYLKTHLVDNGFIVQQLVEAGIHHHLCFEVRSFEAMMW